MRRPLLAAAVAVLAGLTAFAADPPKDTPGAALTRSKKLKAKVTLDAKNEPLRDVFGDVSGQLEDQKLGKLRVTNAPGVSLNQRITYACKDKPLEDALDEMLKAADLGYVVIVKDKDQNDGALKITKGTERGYEAGQEPKGAAKPAAKKPDEPKKPEAKPEEQKPDPPKPSEEDERMARIKLDVAKKLQEDGKADRAKTVLKFVVKHYPGTKAGGEAKELLEKLDK